MWLCEEEQIILRYLGPLGETGASAREISRKAWTKDAFKENERWPYPFLTSLKDKKLILSTASGAYCVPPKEEEEKESKKNPFA